MRLKGIVFLAVAVPVLLAPKAVTAQVPLFESSMDVFCIIEEANGVCTRIGFLLDIASNEMDTQVNVLTITNENTDKWFFADALRFVDAEGVNRLAEFDVTIAPADQGTAQLINFQFFNASGAMASTPVMVVLDMAGSTGTAQDLAESFAYAGRGLETGTPELTFEGVADPVMTVVPEPVTLTLVATGLLGLGGVRVGRRRRKLTAS